MELIGSLVNSEGLVSQELAVSVQVECDVSHRTEDVDEVKWVVMPISLASSHYLPSRLGAEQLITQ